MAVFRQGKVVAVAEERPGLVRARVEVPDLEREITASAFPAMLGTLEAGDRVIVNTTGIELGLGTGGEGFVLWNLDGAGPAPAAAGHIVKLRYTPWQTEVLAAESPESEHHQALAQVSSIDGMPVVVCGLHSQLAGVAAGIKAELREARVGYLMTDGAALPLAWSDLVARLRREELVDATCTAGHAFGGDLEAVNVFSGLAALRVAAEADVAIVALGPGIVGTSTRLGFSGMEQGQALDAAKALGGRTVACLRVSFFEERERHIGISHHAVTALTLAARERSTVVVPKLEPSLRDLLVARLEETRLCERHDVVFVDGRAGVRLLEERGVRPSSMGRPFEEAAELFLAAAAAGRYAARLLH